MGCRGKLRACIQPQDVSAVRSEIRILHVTDCHLATPLSTAVASFLELDVANCPFERLHVTHRRVRLSVRPHRSSQRLKPSPAVFQAFALQYHRITRRESSTGNGSTQTGDAPQAGVSGTAHNYQLPVSCTAATLVPWPWCTVTKAAPAAWIARPDCLQTARCPSKPARILTGYAPATQRTGGRDIM
jgi:hypothetical protein